MGRNHHKDLKKTKLCLGPILTCLEAFLGFPVKTKMKAYTKLTVAMCCQIFARRSVAPSSGDFRRRTLPRLASGQDQGTFSRMLLDPFGGRGGISARSSLRDFSISSDVK